MRTESGIALIGYDGSEDAAAAIRQAAALLVLRRAAVVRVWDSLAGLLLHTDINRLTGGIRAAAEEVDQADREDAGAIALEGAKLAREAGFDAEAHAVRAGRGKTTFWPELLAEADKLDAAVVVVGSRGLGRVKSALLGSVSSGVLHHSRIPVLVLPPPREDQPQGPVIVGFDGSEPAVAAVEAAARLLSARDAVIETVWKPYTPVVAAGTAAMPLAVVTRAADELDKEAANRAKRIADDGARRAAAAGLEARAQPCEAGGAVWAALLDGAEAHRAAAVVVGSRGHTAVGAAVLGSVSTALVHHARVPVLIVPGTAA